VRGEESAIWRIDRRPLTHRDVVVQIERAAEDLRALGIGRKDRVAVLLPVGPDASLCCLSIAATATCAPIPSACTAQELERYLIGLRPKAIITDRGWRRDAAEAADCLGIPSVDLRSDVDHTTGIFRLEGKPIGPPQAGWAEPDDIALLLQTSGSTSLPKIAPLTHRNVLHGAMNNVGQLGLTSQDRCLCITGHFFSQGILVSMLSPLLAGGSVVCTPGYDPARFFEWLHEFQPTWFSAPVTIHRSIAAYADRHPDAAARARLRVLRVASAPSDPGLIAKLEAHFRAPALNSYGLTETSSGVSLEPLPPGRRKPGSVGIATGCDVAIADESGRFLPPGATGEVVVRGPSVIRAYEGGPELNQASFFGEWLRTGDLGHTDTEGHLFLSGRIKEIINRGGEKISPAEIDAVLNAHPDVAEAMTFAQPDDTLGEAVAAAIVLRAEPDSDPAISRPNMESELRAFVASRLGPSKAPRRIVFLKEIPKSPTGKASRALTAEKTAAFESAASRRSSAPGATRQEEPASDSQTMVMLHIWEDVLRKAPIGIHEDFFELGGDSFTAANLLARIEETFHKQFTVANLFQAPTVARMVLLMAESPVEAYFGPSKIIRIRASGSLPPLFLLNPPPVFRSLILALPAEVPVYGLTFPDPASISVPFRLEEIAARQAKAIRAVCEGRPYAMLGWCADGVLGYEIARILEAEGQGAAFLAMVDTPNPARWDKGVAWRARGARMQHHAAQISKLDLKASAGYLRERAKTVQRKFRQLAWRARYRLHLVAERRVSERLRIPDQILSQANGCYKPQPYRGRVLFVRPADRPVGDYADLSLGWKPLVPDLRVVDVPGNHVKMFAPENVVPMARALTDELRRAASQAEMIAEPVSAG
jgi:acyl-CoA synthetase (AMP-forming)/AMP-acid ligase II/thioesterase domain-containing protein/acyl carrier protein